MEWDRFPLLHFLPLPLRLRFVIPTTQLFLGPLGEDPTGVPTVNAGELPWIQLPVPPAQDALRPSARSHCIPESRAGVPDRPLRV